MHAARGLKLRFAGRAVRVNQRTDLEPRTSSSRREECNQIEMSIRAFVRLKRYFRTSRVTYYQGKARIIRGTIWADIAKPLHVPSRPVTLIRSLFISLR